MTEREWENRRAWDRGDREWVRERDDAEWDRNRERRSFSDRDWENRETGERRHFGDRGLESRSDLDWRTVRQRSESEVPDRPRFREERDRYYQETGRGPENYSGDYGRPTFGQSWGQQAYSSTGAYGGGLIGPARGPHAGKGPKNWHRSDERIREDVNEALTRDPYVDATDIDVSVSNGEVTLEGSVDDRNEKHHAEECIWPITGVREVNNHIRVRQSMGGVISSVFKGDEKR